MSDTRGRAGDSFHSPDQQKDAITQAVDGKVVQTFTDLDRSGTNRNRPALQQMLAWLQEDPTRRGVAVYDYSRLSRRMRDMLDLADDITKMGAALMSVKERIDTSTPTGEHMFHTFASMHHLQARMIGERWSDIQRRRLEKGLDPGGPARFGYLKPEKTGSDYSQVQVVDPVMGPVLAQMYRDYIKGHG
ncbi:MAG: recombinase family protein, partial [Ornithinimicrobium sp.]